ncbi:hypothetical protein D3C73_1402230 [compost metagenome]
MQRLHRVGQDARRHHQDEQPGPAEKRAEIEAHAAAVDQETDDDGQHQAEQGADRCCRAFALLEYREQEKHCFQAFAGHGEKHHGDQCDHLVSGTGQCVVKGLVQ